MARLAVADENELYVIGKCVNTSSTNHGTVQGSASALGEFKIEAEKKSEVIRTRRPWKASSDQTLTTGTDIKILLIPRVVVRMVT